MNFQIIKVVNYKTDPEYHYYITRVLDTDTKVVEERIGDDKKYTNASIDIFPIDGTPNNSILRRIYFFRVLYHRALMSLCYKDSIDRKRPRGILEKVFLWMMERIPIEKMTTPYQQKEKIDRLLRKQKLEGAKFIGNIMGAYRTREIVPAEFYGSGKMYPFENIELRGMYLANEYLVYTYGDYMKLPPAKDRIGHHFYRVFKKEYYEKIKERKKSLMEIITIASIVEREAKTKEDKKKVASVIYNRLKAGMPLQMDSILAYITGEEKIKASLKDTQVDSKYNPYKNKGFPPGPICSPGKDSIEAAINPDETEYLYFVASDKLDGTNVFSKTYEEFLKDKAKFDKAYAEYRKKNPDKK